MCWFCSSCSIESKQWQKDLLCLSHALLLTTWSCISKLRSLRLHYKKQAQKSFAKASGTNPFLANFSQAMAGEPVYLKLLPRRMVDPWTSHLLTENRNGLAKLCRTWSYLLCSSLNSQTDLDDPIVDHTLPAWQVRKNESHWVTEPPRVKLDRSWVVITKKVGNRWTGIPQHAGSQAYETTTEQKQECWHEHANDSKKPSMLALESIIDKYIARRAVIL